MRQPLGDLENMGGQDDGSTLLGFRAEQVFHQPRGRGIQPCKGLIQKQKFWLVDERGVRKWVRPLTITGMNAIAVYLASEFLSEFLDATPLHADIYNSLFAPFGSPMNASLFWALSFTLLMYLFAWLLYKRGWFLRI